MAQGFSIGRRHAAGVMRAPLRSLLFVPGDSERKLEKGHSSGADALVFDLEDSVAQARKPLARSMVAEYLRSAGPGAEHWVRINPLTTLDSLHDIAEVVAGRPAGVLLPKARGPADVKQLSCYLDVMEAREGVAAGSIQIIPIATEIAQAPFTLGEYATAALSRLFGLTWGAEDLSADLGAASNRDADGQLSFTYRMVRSLTLLAAKACGVEAVETVFPDFRNTAGLRACCVAARREGFTGQLAIHPDQVGIINEAFSPSVDEIAFAERVVAAFAAQPEAGVVAMDGKMLDKPHLTQAQKVLAMRDALSGRRTP